MFSRFEVSIKISLFKGGYPLAKERKYGIISRSHSVRYTVRVIIESIYSKSIHLSLFTVQEAVERSRLVK